MGALSSSSPLLLRCMLRRPPPSPATAYISSLTPSFFNPSKPTPFISLSPLTVPISHTSLPPRPLSTSTQSLVSTLDEPQSDAASESQTDDRNEPIENERENAVDAKITSAHKEMMEKLKRMSVKEKKELGSYANSLGKKLKSQQVGKSGVTDSVATALVETLEANELLKLKIHNNCPGELDEVVSQLEEATGSVVVGRIGRTVIIYRPSLTKLKAEEKKKQAMKVFLKRRAAFKSSSYQNRGQSSTSPSRSRGVFRKS